MRRGRSQLRAGEAAGRGGGAGSAGLSGFREGPPRRPPRLLPPSLGDAPGFCPNLSFSSSLALRLALSGAPESRAGPWTSPGLSVPEQLCRERPSAMPFRKGRRGPRPEQAGCGARRPARARCGARAVLRLGAALSPQGQPCPSGPRTTPPPVPGSPQALHLPSGHAPADTLCGSGCAAREEPVAAF